MHRILNTIRRATTGSLFGLGMLMAVLLTGCGAVDADSPDANDDAITGSYNYTVGVAIVYEDNEETRVIEYDDAPSDGSIVHQHVGQSGYPRESSRSVDGDISIQQEEHTEPNDTDDSPANEATLSLHNPPEPEPVCCGYIDPREAPITFYRTPRHLYETLPHHVRFRYGVFGQNLDGNGGLNLDIAERFFNEAFSYAPAFWPLIEWPFHSMEWHNVNNGKMIITGVSYIPALEDFVTGFDMFIYENGFFRIQVCDSYDNNRLRFRAGNLYVTMEQGEIRGSSFRQLSVFMVPAGETTPIISDADMLALDYGCREKVRRARIINHAVEVIVVSGGLHQDLISYMIHAIYRHIPSFAWISDSPPIHIIGGVAWTEFRYGVNPDETDFGTIKEKFIGLMEGYRFNQLDGVIDVSLHLIPPENEPDGTGIVFWDGKRAAVSLEKGRYSDGLLDIFLRVTDLSPWFVDMLIRESGIYPDYQDTFIYEPIYISDTLTQNMR